MAKANPLRQRFTRTGLTLGEIKQQVAAHGTIVTISDLRNSWLPNSTLSQEKYDAIMTTLNDIENGNIIEIDEPTANSVKTYGNASIEEHMTATNMDVANVARSTLYWRDRPAVKTDEECAERLAEFWNYIAQTGAYPTIEKMALALGVDRSTVWTWKQGSWGATKRRAQMIRKSITMMASVAQELAATGKINVVSWIFTAKNFYDMHDKQDVIITPNTPITEAQDADELRRKYKGSLPETDEI